MAVLFTAQVVILRQSARKFASCPSCILRRTFPPGLSWTLVANVKRDPFEQAVSFGDSKSAMELGGTLGSPSTAYLYDWNMLPLGQLLWQKELESFKEFPPLQAPET